jgi:hypothetical protein
MEQAEAKKMRIGLPHGAYVNNAIKIMIGIGMPISHNSIEPIVIS